VLIRHWLLLLLINLLFAFNLIVSKVGMERLPPLLFTAARFAIVAAVLWPVLRAPRPQLGTILAIALLAGAVHFALIYLGLALADDVATVAVALQLSVPFATLLGIFVLGERVGWRRWLGMTMAFGGVAWIGFDPRVVGYLDALLLVVLGAFSMALALTLMKRLSGVGVFELQAWIAAVGVPILLVASWLTETAPLAVFVESGPVGWAAVTYSALATSIVAHGSLYYLIQRYDVSFVSPLTLLSSVFAIALGVWLLGDVLTPTIVGGALLTLAGVAIVAARSGRAAAADVAARPPPA
jgi:O-acetylserine/cysteine efflux transporter